MIRNKFSYSLALVSLLGACVDDPAAASPGRTIDDVSTDDAGRDVMRDDGGRTGNDGSTSMPEPHNPDPADAATEPVSDAVGDGTGPDDWGPGDYPGDPQAQEYVELSGIPGQPNIRGYKLHVPASYTKDRPMPVLFAVHGLGQNGVMFGVNGSSFIEKSEAEGFILVIANGNDKVNGSWSTTGSWNAGDCCRFGSQVDDVSYFRAVWEDVKAHLNVDVSRVYVTGHSNGAFMSHRLACEMSDVFVAIGPSAGGIHIPECKPSRPVSVLSIHGTGDSIVNYAELGSSQAKWAELNGCSMSTRVPDAPASGGDTSCLAYEGCPEGVEVIGCTIDGGGHCWFGDETCGTGSPAGTPIVGANSDHFVITDAVWEFFKRQRRAPL